MQSEQIDKLVSALAKAQGQFLPIGKDKSAKIVSKKTGAQYSYDYADLGTILASVRKPLAENGLAIMQPVAIGDGVVHITTLLAHESGQWIDAGLTMPVGDRDDARSVASAITYGRRYSLIALIGVAPSDEDDDGEATSVKPNQMAPIGERPNRPIVARADVKAGFEPPPPSDHDAPPNVNRAGKKVDAKPLTTDLTEDSIPF